MYGKSFSGKGNIKVSMYVLDTPVLLNRKPNIMIFKKGQKNFFGHNLFENRQVKFGHSEKATKI